MTTNMMHRPNSDSHINYICKNKSKTISESTENRFVNRSYLPEGVLRNFKRKFETSSKSLPTSKPHNFVKKLVATLENKKYQGSGHCSADNEFFTKCCSRPLFKNYVPHQSQEKECYVNVGKVNVESLKKNIGDNNLQKETAVKVSNQKDFVNLTTDEYIELNSTKSIFDTNMNDSFEKRMSCSSTKDIEKNEEVNHLDNPESVSLRRKFPYSKNEIDFQIRSDKTHKVSNNYNETKNKKSIFRRSGNFEEKRTFKEFLTSLIGLKRRSACLPKGKPKMFSPKVSLGEEMRLFKKDLMPTLFKAVKSYKTDFEDVSRNDSFSQFINAPKQPRSDNRRSASIHPYYCGIKGGPNFLPTLQEETESQNVALEEKSQFLQNNRECVTLRQNSFSFHQKQPEMIYDVPNSNKVVQFPSDLNNLENSNIYENGDIFNESNWRQIANPVPRKNIICGKRALYIRKRKQQEQFSESLHSKN